MSKIKVVHLLGIITIVELIATRGMLGSVILWVGLGIYKYYQYD